MSALLDVEGLGTGYGRVDVLRDVSIRIEPGHVVALLGPNGAGKTTVLRALSGQIPIRTGVVRWNGEPTTDPLHRRARKGLGVVGEERSIFRQLTVRENFRVANTTAEHALGLFPELEKRLRIRAGLLSGGEQQMLALAMALGRDPSLLLVDELSLGLAPIVVERLLAAVRAAADRGIGVLVVEQHVRRVLEIADYVYVLNRGQVQLEGAASELRHRLEEIEDSYFASSAS